MKFELYYPVKPLHINQIFGNPDPKYKQLGLPGHNGVDFMASHGEPVCASHDGTINSVEIDTYGGHGVVLVTDDLFDYKDGQAKFKTIYWHFIAGSERVKVGDKVKTGDTLGLANSTGFSNGDHLHFGLKPVNQYGGNIEQDNGYFGAIDPAPYFNGDYASDHLNLETQVTLLTKVVNLLRQLIYG